MPLSAGLTSKRALTCRQHLLALLVVVGTLYGSSYQQFRHFDPADPRGLSDAKSYLLMAEGNYNASMTHRFRVMIPALVGWLSTSTNRQDQESLVLLFYIVNFSLMTATGFFLYLILGKVGFKGITSLLGVCMFTCSRTAVYSTAVPLVDSLYYFSIATIVLLCFVERRYSLFMSFPVLIFSKETIMPFLLLPLLLKDGFRPKYLAPHLLSLVVSCSLYFMFRSSFSGWTDSGQGEPTLSAVVMAHLSGVADNLQRFSSLQGIHNVQHSFSVFLVLAIIGFLWTRKKPIPYRIPNFLWALLPIASLYMLLSSNSGRMLFSAFPLVIVYALVVLDQTISENLSGRRESDGGLHRNQADTSIGKPKATV